MKHKALILFFVLITGACNNFICGELTGEWKKIVDTAKTNAGNLIINHITCDFQYINVQLTTKIVDTTAIHSIHKLLYN